MRFFNIILLMTLLGSVTTAFAQDATGEVLKNPSASTTTTMAKAETNIDTETTTTTVAEAGKEDQEKHGIHPILTYTLDVIGLYIPGIQAPALPTSLDLYFGGITAKFNAGPIGAYFDFRFQHQFYTGNYGLTWMEQGYVTYNIKDIVTIMLGSFYNRFGLYATDNTVWLSQTYYTGYAYDSDYGIGADVNIPLGENFSVFGHLGYMILQDGLNGIYVGGNPIVAETAVDATFGNYTENSTLVAKVAFSGTAGPVSFTVGGSVMTGGLASDASDTFNTSRFDFDVDAVIGLAIEGLPVFTIMGQYTSFDQDTANVFLASKGANFANGNIIMFGITADISSYLSTIFAYTDVHFNYSVTSHNADPVSQIVAGANLALNENLYLGLEWINTHVNSIPTGFPFEHIFMVNTYITF